MIWQTYDQCCTWVSKVKISYVLGRGYTGLPRGSSTVDTEKLCRACKKLVKEERPMFYNVRVGHERDRRKTLTGKNVYRN